ncbi:hypothetical protein R4Z10_05330 [Niallia sp. XMNu-256]|uniref:hypothetical protein n=1 Tax=Niallia sp. XMNu-256 TaxID=3082444 RepID=UPI0030CEAEE6
MFEEILEFRGVALQQIQLYLKELGGERLNNHFPIRYQAENWIVFILCEEEISFTTAFKVNSVKIKFSANSEEQLNDVITNFRKKSFRAGG